jgi:hypothetical protein
MLRHVACRCRDGYYRCRRQPRLFSSESISDISDNPAGLDIFILAENEISENIEVSALRVGERER